MIEWNYIVIGLTLLLLAFLLWKESHRPNKSRLRWRLVASTFAVISLACLALTISYTRNVKVDASQSVVLLTEGFEVDSVNALLKRNNKTSIYTLDDKLIASRKFNAKLVSSINSLRKNEKDLSVIHVFGNGLEDDHLQELDSLPVVFHPSKSTTGIQAVNWNKNLIAGDKLYVQGSFNNTSSSTLRMVLKSFNTTLDSIKINPNKTQSFELTTTPKQVGRSVYSLVVLDGKDTVSNNPIPFQVELGEAPKILLLSSTPDFETKFLKNWLGEKGFKTITRSLVSKNKYTKDFLNTEAINVDRITPALLGNFSIVIADATELASISRGELGAIQSLVSSKNLGLVIRASETSAKTFYSNRFPVATIPGNQQQQIHLQLIDTSTSFQTLPIENPISIRNQNGTQPIVTDRQNRIFVSSTLYGSGKIIFTTINNTFSWMLSGNEKDYEGFWSEILNKVIAKKPSDEAWSVSPSLPKINQPTAISVETNQTNIPTAQIAGTTVYLKNDARLPYKWSGTYWPSKTGWQPTIQLNGATLWWYAFDNDDWKSVDAFQKMQRTKQYASAHNASSISKTSAEKKQELEFPKIYFFLIFLLCCGYLWFESKIL